MPTNVDEIIVNLVKIQNYFELMKKWFFEAKNEIDQEVILSVISKLIDLMVYLQKLLKKGVRNEKKELLYTSETALKKIT